MKILFAGYRAWAYRAFKWVEEHLWQRDNHFKNNIDIHYVTPRDKCTDAWHNEFFISFLDESTNLKQVIKEHKPDMMFFVGWSWYVPTKILGMTKCLCIHPSPLPRYRGGSPIQNQIIAGETESAVTLFEMAERLDGGHIHSSREFSLERPLDEIFYIVHAISAQLIFQHIKCAITNRWPDWSPIIQDESKATYCKRRKPEDSEITLEEIQTKSAEYLYNKIRSLYSATEDYPTAYIKCKDGQKLYLAKGFLKDD